MQKPRRSRLETAMDVLYVLENESLMTTPVMYRANLSWKALQEQLTSLERLGMVSKSSSPEGSRRHDVWKITASGITALNHWRAVLLALRQTPDVRTSGTYNKEYPH